jgi:hypothetical protein
MYLLAYWQFEKFHSKESQFEQQPVLGAPKPRKQEESRKFASRTSTNGS